MPEPTPEYRAAVLALPEVTASTLFGVYDLLASAGRDWQFIVEGNLGHSRIETKIVTCDGERFRSGNGVWIAPDCAATEYQPDIVCIPDIFVAPGDSLEGRYDRELDWIRARYDSGAILAAACSGSTSSWPAAAAHGRT
jgi:putative intracellular protease/amidase